MCALTGNFIALSFARLLVGSVRRSASSAAARWPEIAQSRPERSSFCLACFMPAGLGILASGLVAPFVLQAFGPGSWWIVWWTMTLSRGSSLPLMLAPLDAAPASGHASR